MSPSRLSSSIEHLESRIAPAGLVYHYVDVDGDLVTVKISKGTLADVTFTKTTSGLGEQLLEIDLNSNQVFHGANVSVTANPANGFGNGRVNVGFIQAAGIDLGVVSVAGDLGRIEAGDTVLKTAGVRVLSVDSMRLFPLDSTLAPVSTGVYDTVSHVAGALKSLKVRSDIANAGLVADSFGSVVIGGSLIGSTDLTQPNLLDFTGELFSNTGFGTVVIKGDIRGGAGNSAGSVVANGGNIGRLVVDGSVIGGSGVAFTGSIYASGKIGSLAIAGDLVGGSGLESGYIFAGGTVSRIAIGGSVYGGSASNTGEIFLANVLKVLTVGGQLVGGNNQGASLTETGYIQALRFSNATIGGIVSGVDDGSGLTNSGALRAYDNIVKLTIRRDLLGNETNPVFITGYGQPIQTKTDLAIGTLTVGGSVRYGEILAGYDVDPTLDRRGLGSNGDAQIGRVLVKGNFIASSLVAGVTTTDAYFGDADDASVAGASARIFSRIGSVVIGGQAYGTVDPTDVNTYGITAQLLGSIKIGALPFKLTAGASNDTFAAGKDRASGATYGPTNTDGFDFHIYETV